MTDPSRVAVSADDAARYSDSPPYHAPEAYPESPFPGKRDETNAVYSLVRESLRRLELDSGRFGTPEWNPLGGLIQPGQTVLLKPNMIAHKCVNSDEWRSLITHGSVVRAVADYAFIALGGRGRIVIADAPQEDSHGDLIKERMGIDLIRDLYCKAKDFDVEFLDLRDKHRVEKDGVYVDTVDLPGDPRGNARTNLGPHSYFAEHDGLGKRYYGAYYDVDETNRHHSGGVHEYMISRSALEADVFISLPKLKTHKKVGVTLNLKSLVGINGQKNWLPHYAIGSPDENGDQFDKADLRGRIENSLVLKMKSMLLKKNPVAQFAARKMKSVAYKVFGGTDEVVRSGNWHGNDTCWRMTLDLNRILMYAKPDGSLGAERKRYFSVVDGIVGMEGNGPQAGTAKPAGVIAAGFDPVAVDVVCAGLMGFDYRKIALLRRAFDEGPYPLSACRPADVTVVSDRESWQGPLEGLLAGRQMAFEPHFGWKGHMETSP